MIIECIDYILDSVICGGFFINWYVCKILKDKFDNFIVFLVLFLEILFIVGGIMLVVGFFIFFFWCFFSVVDSRWCCLWCCFDC